MVPLMLRTNRNIPLGSLGDDTTDYTGGAYSTVVTPPPGTSTTSLSLDQLFPNLTANPYPNSSSSGSSWLDLLAKSLSTGMTTIAAPILNAQFGYGSQPGQVYSTNAKTGQTTIYTVPTGSTSLSMPSASGIASSLSSYMPLLIIGGVALLAFKMMGK